MLNIMGFAARVSLLTMPTLTDRQLAEDALHRAYLVNLMANIEAETWVDVDSDSDSSGSDSYGSSSSSDWDSSSSSSTSSSSSDEDPTPAELYLEQLGELYSDHYYNERGEIGKSREFLHRRLGDYKHNRPEIFRAYLCITPACFDDLVDSIKDDEVFQNQSNNSQMPVQEQAAIALYHFGHYGNAASTMKVALQLGVGYGTVRLVTTRIMKACCSERF